MKQNPKKGSLLLYRDLPVNSFVCMLTAAIMAAMSITYLICNVLLRIQIFYGNRMDASTQFLFGGSLPLELISNILVLLAAFGIYRLGLFMAKPKVPQTTEGKESPAQEELPSHLSFSEEQTSLLREIRDYLKEHQNHE